MMPEDWQIGIFVHVAAVFLLGIAVGASLGSYAMMRHARTVQEVRVWGGLGRILGQYQVLPLTSLVLFLSGAYLVDELSHEWTEGWIGFSALALIAAVTIGYVIISPRMKMAGMTAGRAPDGPVPEELHRVLNDPVLYGASNTNPLLAVAIIWNMTTRPDNVEALLVLVVLGAIGAATGLTRLNIEPRREDARESPAAGQR